MTKSEWNEVVKILNAMYEDKGRLMFETPEKIKIWYECLSDLNYLGCCEAVKRHALVSEFQPKIADIRKQYATIMNTDQMMSEVQAWDMVRKAIGDSLYHAEDRFNAFPEFIKRIVVSPDRLTEWAQMPSETVSAVVRAEFRRGYESVLSSIREERQIGDKQLGLSQKIAEQLRIGGK